MPELRQDRLGGSAPHALGRGLFKLLVGRPRLAAAAVSTVVSVLSWAMPSLAQHQFEENAEHRTTVAMHVNEAEIAKFLPAPWVLDIPTSGTKKGFDLILEFRDRILDLDEQKQPVKGGSERGLVLLVPAKNPVTGDAGLRVIREYTANPNFIPGLYNNSKVLSRMRLTQNLVAEGTASSTSTEIWDLEEPGGGVADLSFDCTRGVPKRVIRTHKMFGSDDPNLIRIYHSDQGRDLVRDVAGGVDSTRNFTLKVTLKELAPMFDGSERLISVEVLPWYLREVFNR